MLDQKYQRFSFGRAGRHLLVAAALLVWGILGHASWPVQIGSFNDDEIVAVKTSPSGDVFVAGHFSGEIEIDGFVLTPQGLQDMFIARLGGGGQIKWIHSAGGPLQDKVTDIVLDDSNNVYLVGEFSDQAEFGGSQIFATGPVNGFVAKINGQGSWQWARVVETSGLSRATGVVPVRGDATVVPQVPDSVVVLGTYECNAYFGDTGLADPVQLNRNDCFPGRQDLFLARYKANGEIIWAKDRGSDSSGFETAERLVIDGNSRITVLAGEPVGGLVQLFDDNFSGGMGNWVGSHPSRSLVSNPGADLHPWANAPHPILSIPDLNLNRPMLSLRGGPNDVRKNQAFDTSNFSGLRLSLKAMRGASSSFTTFHDPFPIIGGTTSCGAVCQQRVLTYIYYHFPAGFWSDRPNHASEYLQVQYLAANGQWVEIERLPAGSQDAEPFDFTGENVLDLIDPSALHPNFQVRFRMNAGSGTGTVTLRTIFYITQRRTCVFSCGDWYTHDWSSSTNQATAHWDWWHVDQVGLEAIPQNSPLVFRVTNVKSDSGPTFNTPIDLPQGVSVKDMALNSTGSRLFIHGDRFDTLGPGFCGGATGNGAFIASLNADSSFNCVWLEDFDGGTAQGITVDKDDDVYVTGSFIGDMEFNSEWSLTSNSASASDVYIAKVEVDGGTPTVAWATGGGELDADIGIPAFAGGFDHDAGLAISTDGVSTLYVGGRFRSVALFGPSASLAAAGGSDGFLINLGLDGRFFEEKGWIAGVPVVPPPNAEVSSLVMQPDFQVDGEPFDAIGQKIFAWGAPVQGQPAQLIPLQPFGTIEVLWRVEGDDVTSTSRIPALGSISWPIEPCTDSILNACYQVHVVGAPVEAEPPTGDFKVLEVIEPMSGSSGAAISSGVYTANRSGTGVVVYLNGPTLDPQQHPTVVEIVRSLPYTAVPFFFDGIDTEIGQKITDPFHNEPNRTGWVVNELAFYDGHGPDAAYSRQARTGSIIPVNRYRSRPQDQGRELAVAWYRQNAKGVFWPGKVVRYNPHWPFDPERIIIASQTGGEVLGQQPLNPLIFNSARIYVQNDFELPGFNPNDEHAFMAPSALGSGHEAVFALRSDFGSNLANDQAAASDPYVLVKYFDNASLEWRFRIYRVDATGAGFTSFRFPGTAGTTVAPPYPVSLLVPGCAETFVDGQAVGEQPPPPFFQDYTNQLWSKSEGSGTVHYYYPAQPGFFTDLANNDENDIETSDCVPWLPRLLEEDGGSVSSQDPIPVVYDITWPEQVPLLTIGETLLEPKRGLPDIFNQAAVEVIFDEVQETKPNALPSDTLAQLFDPLNPRFVYLDEIPEAIATELQTNGTRAILGSDDGSIKLPVSIRDRISYDPLNKRLELIGLFDDSGAGEPFLLLNVLSKRDRVVLKTLDGGDGSEAQGFTNDCSTPDSGCSWDQAVEALFRLSRNPQGIKEICVSSFINDNRERVCQQPRDVTADDVLIGLQDTSGQGILSPFQAVGVKPALSAGLAQGSGYLTVAFNNDPGLTPLPVSLEIIRVGCLRSPPPPDPAVILSTYQGQINVISPDNIFDEQLVLRHSGDFGGNPDALEFEWFFKPDIDGTPPLPVPDPENGQLNGWIQFPVSSPQGAVEISIAGANIQTLSDNWYLARYRGLPACGNDTGWSLWAGNPGATPINQFAQLAEGWVKRVVRRLNPFEARVQDFAQAATNNYASMLIQLGERYEGPIALNNDPDNLNNFGLIEAYTTVMRRAMQLSVDGTPPVNYGPANNAILLVASRLVDFYTLLGNEAFADAQDPTIGITTNNDQFSLAPSIFNFQNQVASLLEEELVLLRGRDTSLGPVAASPVYNRFFWNFTSGDGEIAYALSYNISDQNDDGVINELDARIMFPQGHGDSWGHYLTASKIYYDLLRHPFFTWEPRAEAVAVAGVPITVDFLDERQFAETAAAKARTGAEIVDLTYRSRYVEDPDGQWQGYQDTNPDRAWGLSEWGRRSGMGAYFDWVTTNSILPDEDPDPNAVGIQRIDRTTVAEIGEISAHYQNIQGQVDKADAGLNPLGLATGVVPFDIDPSQIDNNKTQFEQILERAMSALNNAVEVWDFANKLTNQMRRNQNEVDDLRVAANAQETDFANQLIEIFGYPYADDIGPGETYPAGYDGPDLYNYMLIDVPALAGTAFDFDADLDRPIGINRINRFTGSYTPMPNGVNFFNMTPSPPDNQHVGSDGQSCGSEPTSKGCALGELNVDDSLEVEYTTIESPDFGFWFTKPEDWQGSRRAPGELQQILQQMLQARISLQQAVLEYDALRDSIESEIETLRAVFDVTEDNLNIKIGHRNELRNLTIAVETMKATATVAKRAGEMLDFTFKSAVECIPTVFIAGLAAGGDMTSGIRCGIKSAGNIPKLVLDTVADGLNIAASATDAAKQDVSEMAGIKTAINDANISLFNQVGEIDALMRREPILRSEIFARTEAIKQLTGNYQATLAGGLRTLERLISFRRHGAAEIQEYRYQDMAFRIFRNDALQKYRAAFDLAARYAYLAAAAYDYDTNLLGSDGRAGQRFLTDIVRQRNLGQIIGGEPIPGSPGLANTLAQLKLNFDVLKGQMGFNNPQVETNRFSLRRELFRIPDGPEGDEQWRRRLEGARVSDLWAVPEFRRYARPFAAQSAGPQPGLVLEFTTNISFGLNFFGWDLGPGDSTYDSSRFSTRVRSVGTWFGNYDQLPLAETPRIYLFPVGADVLRAPDANDFSVREWQVLDQVVPIPFPISTQDLERFDWMPISDTLNESPTEIRRYSRLPAFHFQEPFDDSQVVSDSRLIGRSVWNRRWVIIIPGGTFLADPVEGLETFINGELIPGGGGERDGQGVNDILIFFKTYSYSGS
jgi:hypothetical protein